MAAVIREVSAEERFDARWRIVDNVCKRYRAFHGHALDPQAEWFIKYYQSGSLDGDTTLTCIKWVNKRCVDFRVIAIGKHGGLRLLNARNKQKARGENVFTAPVKKFTEQAKAYW